MREQKVRSVMEFSDVELSEDEASSPLAVLGWPTFVTTPITAVMTLLDLIRGLRRQG